MNRTSPQHEHRVTIGWTLAAVGMLLLGGLLLTYGETAAVGSTPLQQSGLVPLWQENFTSGSIDRLQYAWVSGDNAALTSCVIPGAIYLGETSVPISTSVPVQQLNNFKASAGEALPSTLEFDVFSPTPGFGRVSLRPRRVGDLVGMLLYTNSSGKTQVNYNEDGAVVTYTVTTGVSGQWDHVVVSYRQEPVGDPAPTTAHYVVAINEEVQEHSTPTGISPAWSNYWGSTNNADGWSFEHSTNPNITMGKYIANVRAYSGFLAAADLQNILSGTVSSYVGSLAAPAACSNSPKSFLRAKTLVSPDSYALAYANQPGPLGNLTVNFDGSLSSAYNRLTSYQWSFGDGSTGSGRFANHTYAWASTYSASLSVTSQAGTDSYTFPLTVNGTADQMPRYFLPFIQRY